MPVTSLTLAFLISMALYLSGRNKKKKEKQKFLNQCDDLMRPVLLAAHELDEKT